MDKDTKRYHVWPDSESYVDGIEGDFDTLEEASDYASGQAHRYDGAAFRVILHVEDRDQDETVDTVENIITTKEPTSSTRFSLREAIAHLREEGIEVAAAGFPDFEAFLSYFELHYAPLLKVKNFGEMKNLTCFLCDDLLKIFA